ncbi:hypothetical protein VTJ04DRAFT_4792 [Mycothermus thermophilus]|uniref:uncharacterized protein n=1 Tax=Humicola insolens TaxID=85995 RepID=UPI0037439A17
MLLKLRSVEGLGAAQRIFPSSSLHQTPTTTSSTQPGSSLSTSALSPPDHTPLFLTTDTMGGGGKIPYPKHVWSPSGGWYCQPANWKRNTAIAFAVIFGIEALLFKLSGELEYRAKMPEPDRFFPSRYISKQIIEYEKAQREKAQQQQQSS